MKFFHRLTKKMCIKYSRLILQQINTIKTRTLLIFEEALLLRKLYEGINAILEETYTN